MINLIVWLVAGGVIGWVASIMMRTNAQQGIILNVIVGVIGALIGGLLLGSNTINQNVFNLNALVISLIGAIVLLAVVNLVRRGRLR